MNDPSSLHLYAYCANNPVNYVDPSGHVPMQLSIAMYLYSLKKHKGWQIFKTGSIASFIEYNLTNSKAFKRKLITKIKGNKKTFVLRDFGFEDGNSYDRDLRYSIGHATLNVKWNYDKGVWIYKRYKVSVSLWDIYDFDYFGKKEKNLIKRYVNDYLGYWPQKKGVTHKYYWKYSRTSSFLFRKSELR